MNSKFPVTPTPEAPTFDHPLCKATMFCMRGPCQYYWTMISRQKAPGDHIRIKHSQACLADMSMDLNDQNIYLCDNWWPAPLSFVPDSIRPILRKFLSESYERYLKLKRYDFSWKTWEDDTFTIDSDKTKISNLKLGEH